MVYLEIISEAKRLPLDEQLRLVEELLRAMRQTAAKPVQADRERPIPFAQLRGVLKPAGPLPSDADLEDAYTEHLLDKYL